MDNDISRIGATRVHVMGLVCRRQSWDALKPLQQRKMMWTGPRYLRVPDTFTLVHMEQMLYLPVRHALMFRHRLLLHRCLGTPTLLPPIRSLRIRRLLVGG